MTVFFLCGMICRLSAERQAVSTLKTKQKVEVEKANLKKIKFVKNYFKLSKVYKLNTKCKVNCLKELEIELKSLILAQDERWRHA